MSTKTTMTERDIYTSIIDGTYDIEVLKTFAEKKMAQLDKRNETARKRAEKRKAEGDALLTAVLNVLGDEPMSREDVFNAIVETGMFPEVKLGQVGFRLTALSKPEDGRVVKTEATIADAEGKNRRVMVYTLA